MGAGSPGYCKICDFRFADVLNRKLADEGEKRFTSAAAQRFARDLEPGFTFDRETWRKHKDHITHPLVTLQKQALADPIIVPKTNQGKLEAIADIGMKRALENPEAVSVDHALKALGILEQKKDRRESIWVILAKSMTGQQAEVNDYIEGEFKVIEPRELEDNPLA